MQQKHFKNLNEKNNFTPSKDNSVSKYEALDTSVSKLRKKYNNLKTEWRKISDRAKSEIISASRFPFLFSRNG